MPSLLQVGHPSLASQPGRGAASHEAKNRRTSVAPVAGTQPENERLEGPKMMGLGKGNSPLNMAIVGIYIC